MTRKWVNMNNQYPQMPYDLIKEMLIAVGIMGALAIVLAGIFSTPDVPALSAKQVAAQEPSLIVQNALDDLSHQDAISTYGPPYSNTKGAAQTLLGLSPQKWAGEQLPINSAKVNVIAPLEKVLMIDPSLKDPLSTWNRATAQQQSQWVKNVESSLKNANYTDGVFTLPSNSSTSYGPLPTMLNSYLSLARSGLLEASIDGTNGPNPIVNRTDSLLLFQDVPDAQYASKLDMTGDQWGVIKETGNYPGAVWLWFYTLLYQIPPFVNSDSADLWVVVVVALVTIILILVPFLPGLRDIPKGLGVYKLIWRRWYSNERKRKGTRA